jgi:hypothetical protein
MIEGKADIYLRAVKLVHKCVRIMLYISRQPTDPSSRPS